MQKILKREGKRVIFTLFLTPGLPRIASAHLGHQITSWGSNQLTWASKVASE